MKVLTLTGAIFRACCLDFCPCLCSLSSMKQLHVHVISNLYCSRICVYLIKQGKKGGLRGGSRNLERGGHS